MALAQAEPPEIARTNRDSKNLTKLIVATSVGNALATIRQLLLLTFGTFGVAFLIRPIGGVLLGSYADRHGRKASLMVSIVMMTFATLAVALMPTFLGIGVLAPLAVVVARLLQGFSAGGEFGSSTALLVEHMPHRRGFVASFQLQASASAACLGRGGRASSSASMRFHRARGGQQRVARARTRHDPIAMLFDEPTSRRLIRK